MVTKESSRKSGGEKLSHGNKPLANPVDFVSPKRHGKKRKSETNVSNVSIKTENVSQEGGKIKKAKPTKSVYTKDKDPKDLMLSRLATESKQYNNLPYSECMQKINWDMVKVDGLTANESKEMWENIEKGISKSRTMFEVVVSALKKNTNVRKLGRDDLKKVLDLLPPGREMWNDWVWKQFESEISKENPNVSENRKKWLGLQKFRDASDPEKDKLRAKYLVKLKSYEAKCNQLLAKDATLRSLVNGKIGFTRNGYLQITSDDQSSTQPQRKGAKSKKQRTRKTAVKAQAQQEEGSEDEELDDEGSEDEELGDEGSEDEESGDSEDEEL